MSGLLLWYCFLPCSAGQMSYHNLYLCLIISVTFCFTHGGLLSRSDGPRPFSMVKKTLVLPLPSMPHHYMCPVRALKRAFSLSPQAPNSGPAWVLPGSLARIITIPMFIHRFRQILSLGNLPPSSFAGHSFRRGGAMWAYKCGIKPDTVKRLGDWKSDVYQAYAQPDFQVLKQAVSTMQQHL